MYRFLLYLTNNLPTSQHETEFDLWFFIIATICTLVGIPWFMVKGEPHWAVLLIFWYVQFWDQIRFNRDKKPANRQRKFTEAEPLAPNEEL